VPEAYDLHYPRFSRLGSCDNRWARDNGSAKATQILVGFHALGAVVLALGRFASESASEDQQNRKSRR